MFEQHNLEKAKNKSMDSSQHGPRRVCILPVERGELDAGFKPRLSLLGPATRR